MEFGISTACFYPMEVEKALEKIVSKNIPVAEIFTNSPSELSKDFIKIYKKILENGDTKISSIHPFTSNMEAMLFFSDYSRRTNDAVEWYKEYFFLASELGAKFVVLHGGIAGQDIEYSLYTERYLQLCQCGKSFGVDVAHENVCRNIGNSPEIFSYIRKVDPDVHFVLDLKQAIRSGKSAEQFVDAMGKNISHLHLSDSNSENDCLPIGSGNFDFLTFFNKLKDLEVNCSGVVELYSTGYQKADELWLSIQNLTNYV